jgi:hypothetical protein
LQIEIQDNKDVWKLVLGKHNLTSPMSSYSRPEVTTKSQSYYFTHSVKAITVTSTAKGITSKHLLIGTIGDQVGYNLFRNGGSIVVSSLFCDNICVSIIFIYCYLILYRYWQWISVSLTLVGQLTPHNQRRKKEFYLLQIHCLSFLKWVALYLLLFLYPSGLCLTV